jgi:aspartate carbamoyltransferase regulatory subunit
MTTLTINEVCVTHTPNKIAKSFHNDTCYTFCEVCEQNIESFYIDSDGDRLGSWSKWVLS